MTLPSPLFAFSLAILAAVVSLLNEADAQQAVTKVFEKFGLNSQDPRIAPALLKQYTTPEEKCSGR